MMDFTLAIDPLVIPLILLIYKLTRITSETKAIVSNCPTCMRREKEHGN